MLKHLPADVPRYCHDGLLARLPFGQLGYAGMPEIMEAQTRERAFQAAHISLAFGIVAGISRALKPLALRAFDSPRGRAPSRPPRPDRP